MAMVSRPREQRLRALWEAIATMGSEDADATIAALRVLRRDVAARERLRLVLDGSPAAVALVLGAISEPARRELSSPTPDLSDPALLAWVDRLQRYLSNGLADGTRDE